MIIRKSQAKQNLMTNATIDEYRLATNLKDLAIAVGEITGRRPRVRNTVCTEVIFVSDGEINILMDGEPETAYPGDLIIISPNTSYILDGHAKIFIATTPAFYPEQHETLEE